MQEAKKNKGSVRAIALISGGLDSMLAAKVIQAQGIKVVPVYFKIPFRHKSREGLTRLQEAVEKSLGEKLIIRDISEEFLGIIRSPRYGFGSNMNPCVDCKVLMMRKAKELMADLRASFVSSGEVLGQRPMSQHKQALMNIEKQAGLEGLVVRPLSARLLAESIPEKNGWLKREKLLAFSGRTRKPQFALARELGIADFQQPAGGCLLTDPEFSARLRDLLKHQELSLENIELLKLGRHFRLSPKAKLIVGRDEEENGLLLSLAGPGDHLIYTRDIAGPVALARGRFDQGMLRRACEIACSYCDLDDKIEGTIYYRKADQKEELSFTLKRPSRKDAEQFRIKLDERGPALREAAG